MIYPADSRALGNLSLEATVKEFLEQNLDNNIPSSVSLTGKLLMISYDWKKLKTLDITERDLMFIFYCQNVSKLFC